MSRFHAAGALAVIVAGLAGDPHRCGPGGPELTRRAGSAPPGGDRYRHRGSGPYAGSSARAPSSLRKKAPWTD
jgi:hypothetical protein